MDTTTPPCAKPARLRPGDTVRLISPASPPEAADVARSVALLEALGLRAELGRHVFDRHGYLAGRDADRLADLNDALADPAVRAIVATHGGRGAYRIADGLDAAAARADPKPLVGFSEVTILHLALWRRAGVPGLHGACWDAERFGVAPARSFHDALLSAEPVTLHARPDDDTAAPTTAGTARGVLLGGNLDMIATAAGWILPSFAGAILLIEDVSKGLGHVDRALTRLVKAGCLDGLRGIAVGQFTGCGAAAGWTVVDVLRDRLALLDVPILGGLPLGHGADAVVVPVGTAAILDANTAR
jgi:muramoyltetrapeptide carboxypeptidase